MKIAIIGSNGQLGCDLVKALSREDLLLLTHSQIEISDSKSVNKIFQEHRPAVVINTAAFHHVSNCESDDLRAFKVNSLGAKYLAECCLEFNSILVQISTDYVFDGMKDKPYLEDDLPNPLNVYGLTKLAAEYYIRSLLDKYFIIRTSALYGINRCRGKNGNFIDAMLKIYKDGEKIRVVNDEILSPTYSLDLAVMIKRLINTNSYGLFHITNQGSCSWYEFAEKIFEFLGIDIDITPVKARYFQSAVRRPAYSVLESKRLDNLGLGNLRPWQEALKDYLKERKKADDKID
jgi:dTDP-4-dehydrorhamnose reductase